MTFPVGSRSNPEFLPGWANIWKNRQREPPQAASSEPNEQRLYSGPSLRLSLAMKAGLWVKVGVWPPASQTGKKHLLIFQICCNIFNLIKLLFSHISNPSNDPSRCSVFLTSYYIKEFTSILRLIAQCVEQKQTNTAAWCVDGWVRLCLTF